MSNARFEYDRLAASGGMFSVLRKMGPLGFIILLHVLVFYAVQSGLWRQVANAAPKEVFATLITPPAEKVEITEPKPAPKTVPVVKKATPKPIEKPLPKEPSERAIAAEPPAPTPPVAAAPAPAAPAIPKTISGVEYIQPPQPEYPAASRRQGETGKVMVRVLVNEKGRAETAVVQQSSGFTRLDEAARQAALRALFKPYVEDGKPLAVFAVIPIRFNLDS